MARRGRTLMQGAGRRRPGGRWVPDKPVASDAVIRMLQRQGHLPPDISELSGKRYIYVVESGYAMVKVGIASDIDARIRTMQIGSPHELILEYLVPVDASVARKVELAAHKSLRSRRMHGEWFSVDPATAYRAVLRARAMVTEASLIAELEKIAS